MECKVTGRRLSSYSYSMKWCSYSKKAMDFGTSHTSTITSTVFAEYHVIEYEKSRFSNHRIT